MSPHRRASKGSRHADTSTEGDRAPVVWAQWSRPADEAAEYPHRTERVRQVELSGGDGAASGGTAGHCGTNLTHGRCRQLAMEGAETLRSIGMEAEVGYPYGGVLRHSIVLSDRNGRPELIEERVETSETHANERVALSYYRPPPDGQAALEFAKANAEAALEDSKRRSVRRMVGAALGRPLSYWGRGLRRRISPRAVPVVSLLPRRTIRGFGISRNTTSVFGLFRNWSFGPYAELRKNQSAHDRADFLKRAGPIWRWFCPISPEKTSVSSLRLCRSSTMASSTSIFRWSAAPWHCSWRRAAIGKFPPLVYRTARCVTSVCWRFCFIQIRPPWSQSRSRSWVCTRTAADRGRLADCGFRTMSTHRDDTLGCARRRADRHAGERRCLRKAPMDKPPCSGSTRTISRSG